MRKNKKRVLTMKDTPISSNLAIMLLSMVENKSISTELYQSLDDDEKDLIEKFINTDKTINRLNHKRYDQSKIDELINKFKILKGEILIGNNNQDLLHKLKMVILQLINFGVLHLKDIAPLLQTILLLI